MNYIRKLLVKMKNGDVSTSRCEELFHSCKNHTPVQRESVVKINLFITNFLDKFKKKVIPNIERTVLIKYA